MLKSLVQISLIVYTICDQIYPIQSTQEKQLENNGWIDCQQKTEILPTNCQGDDLLWLECYQIPQNGLCSKQNIVTQSSESLNFAFTFYSFSDNQINIQIDGASYNPTFNSLSPLTRAIVQTTSQNAEIKILNAGQYFTGLTISKNCLPNCDTCDTNGFCSTGCSKDYYYYNYRCSRSECEDQIQQLNSQSLQNAAGSVKEGNYILTLQFDFSMGDCLVPKVYYTYALTNSQIKLILNEDQIIYNDENTLQITLPIDQVTKNCEMVNTTTQYVYSCYIGIAVTNEQFTQYLAVVVGQVSVNKETQTTTQFTQSITVPSDVQQSVGPVFVVSETLSVSVNSNKQIFTVLQTISDPDFSNFRITYYEAYVEQNNNTYNLSLESEIQQQTNTTFQFSWNSNKFDPSQAYQLYVNSLAQPNSQRRRILEVSFKREELKVNYNAQNTYTFVPSVLQFTPTLDNGSMTGVIAGCFVAVGIIAATVTYLLNMTKKNQNTNTGQQQLPIKESDK